MSLKKRKRTAIGKMSMQKDYPKSDFEQAIDLVLRVKVRKGLDLEHDVITKKIGDTLLTGSMKT